MIVVQFFCVPLDGMGYFNALDVESMVFVWAPEFGFIKCPEWFTVNNKNCPCSIPAILFYNWFRFNMLFYHTDLGIISSPFSTVVKKHFLESRSILPNTKTPSTRLPLWYFLFSNLHTSVSTLMQDHLLDYFHLCV